MITYRKVYNLCPSAVNDLRLMLIKSAHENGNIYQLPHVVADIVSKVLPIKSVSYAESTYSVYVTLVDDTVLRIADHSSSIWLGFNKRNNRNGFIEINVRWSFRKIAEKILTINRLLCENME